MLNNRGITTGIGIVVAGCALAACGARGEGSVEARSENPASVANAGSAQSAEEPAGGSAAGDLGPTGIGELTLGMTVAQAKDTGLLGQEANGDTGDCAAYLLADSVDQGNGSLTALWFSSDAGLGAITTISETLTTPQEVSKGMSEAEAREVYPELGTTGAVISTDVPGNEAALFSFTTIDGTIASLTLGQRSNECFKAWFETQQPGGPETLGSVLGPDGYGGLTLGMTYEDAARQNLVRDKEREWAECATFTLADGNGTASFKLNGGAFDVTVNNSAVHTPEGVGVGSTVEELSQAFPEGFGEADGFSTPVTAQHETYYIFSTPEQGTATSMSLVRPDDGCMG